MFETGISAYLLKNVDKNEIKATLEKVARGQIVFSGFIEPEVETIFRSGFADTKFSLTNHQKEFVLLLSQGLTQQQIADKQNISVSTVEKTLKTIREKCNAKSNTEMVRILFEKGII
jgi:DNA-binding NarL/FixJ family response regulator